VKAVIAAARTGMGPMIGRTVFTILAIFGGAFMVYALARFHWELKRPKRTPQLHCESEPSEWRVLSPFARRTSSPAEPGNIPEKMVMIETPNFGPIPLVRTVVSASIRSSGDGGNHRVSVPRSEPKEVLNFRKRSVS
jgi:hypothetical protein